LCYLWEENSQIQREFWNHFPVLWLVRQR
jgi:hypothetical protein